jgi:NAD(P)-dependent dehydrogenase (short-subunit alcohol dehydrogenase family)
VGRMIEQAKDTFGGLHAIVNPAGILRDGMFHKMTEEDWDRVIQVHLRGSFNVARASIELFREQKDGAYVLFTSTSGLIGNIGQANYAAAKMGIVGLSRIVAMEGARNNVRSNVIAPFAWTRMIASIPVKDEASAWAGCGTPCGLTRWRNWPWRCARTPRNTSPARFSVSGATRSCCSTSPARSAPWQTSRVGIPRRSSIPACRRWPRISSPWTRLRTYFPTIRFRQRLTGKTSLAASFPPVRLARFML